MAALFLLLGLRSASADLDVQSKDGLLTVRARAVPLVELLDRLSRETGMKLVYMGGRPSQAITVNIEGVSESEAVSRILEGLGLSYLFQMDPSRQRVVMLIIHETTRAGSPTTAARALTPAPRDASSRQAPSERSLPPEEAEDDSPEPSVVNPPSAPAAESSVPSPAPAEIAIRTASPSIPGSLPPAAMPPANQPQAAPGSSIPAWARGSNSTAPAPGAPGTAPGVPGAAPGAPGVPPPALPEDPSSPSPPPQD
jgi:hypothetical protein